MTDKVESFYDALAERYHQVFDDWDRSIERQAAILRPLLSIHVPRTPLRILDCACGIGTQAIGLAKMGHRVIASDLSKCAVERARLEAKKRSVDITFYVSDMSTLQSVYEGNFDLVVALDNALPHLTQAKLAQACKAIAAKLKRGGAFLASIRDYDALWLQKPRVLEPAFYGADPKRRIVHQIWDWLDEERYLLHLFLSEQCEKGWETHHYVGEYRCLLREDLSTALLNAGFANVQWLLPGETGFYQPLVLARLPAGA